MIKRIDWKKGDSSPAHGTMTIYVQGDGSIHLPLGFPVSSAIVTFAEQGAIAYYSYSYYYYDYDSLPLIYVESVDDTGFTMAYRNIQECIVFSYYAQ
jgi:hypothetical protein